MTQDSGYSAADNTVRLRDGRALGYSEYGHANGPVLLYFHGHPGSRLEARFLAGAADQAGVRLIGIDRPGMGLSSYQPRRRILDWPDDVLELAEWLSIGRFSVVGFSGGAPYALACAYRIPNQINACGLVAGVGRGSPITAVLASWLPWILTFATRSLFADPERAESSLRRFADRWPEPDRVALNIPGVSELMAAALAEAFRQGARGSARDGTLLGSSKGFPLRQISGPTMHLWHGALDHQVRIESVHAVAAELPLCTTTYYPDEAHISLIINHAQDIVTALTAG
jgi:pimeloyl-ACP methyl ester carboxylesterase